LLTQDRNAGERDREVSWIDRPRQQRIPSSSENFGIYKDTLRLERKTCLNASVMVNLTI
jgi:hypothetical protein